MYLESVESRLNYRLDHDIYLYNLQLDFLSPLVLLSVGTAIMRGACSMNVEAILYIISVSKALIILYAKHKNVFSVSMY